MKRIILFTSIFLTLSMGLIAFFAVKPKAYINTDYKHIDDINYIAVNHDFDNFTTYTDWFNGSHFNISFNETSNIYGLPSTFETVSQAGSLIIYFTSNRPYIDFSDTKATYLLTISNESGSSYEYVPHNVTVQELGSIYRLSADFESTNTQVFDIASNSWSFSFKIFGDYGSGDDITVLSDYGENNKSRFNWFYYKDFDTNIDDYWRGYGDGLNDGYNDGLTDGYDNGKTDGIAEGYRDGYAQGLIDGSLSGDDYSFAGLLGQVFIGLGSLLAINLLPGISLGAIIAVPVVFGIIAFILGKRGGKDD